MTALDQCHDRLRRAVSSGGEIGTAAGSLVTGRYGEYLILAAGATQGEARRVGAGRGRRDAAAPETPAVTRRRMLLLAGAVVGIVGVVPAGAGARQRSARSAGR
jgi:hypothetical protein